MENDHLIVMVLSIVAVVGIVSMVLAGSRSIATPITFSQESLGTNNGNTAGKMTALPSGETSGTKCTTQQYATMTLCHYTYQSCMNSANMVCQRESYKQQTPKACAGTLACADRLNLCLSRACKSTAQI